MNMLNSCTRSQTQSVVRPGLVLLPICVTAVLLQGCATGSSVNSSPRTAEDEYGTPAGQSSVSSQEEATAPQSQVAPAESPATGTGQSSATAEKTAPVASQTSKTTPTSSKTTEQKARTAEKKAAPAPAVTKPKPTPKPAVTSNKPEAVSKPKPAPVRPQPQPEPAKPAAAPALALAEPPTTETADLASQAVSPGELSISAADLPYSFGTWTLERNWDNQHPDTCRLITDSLALSDGYEMTSLRAEIRIDAIHIYTGSHIDLSYENSGLQFDEDSVLPYTALQGETNATLKGDYTDKLGEAQTLTVNLGFWPTWPKTETQQLVLSLEEMSQALPALKACKSL